MRIELTNALILSINQGTSKRGNKYVWVTVFTESGHMLRIYGNESVVSELARLEPRQTVDLQCYLTGNNQGVPFLSFTV